MEIINIIKDAKGTPNSTIAPPSTQYPRVLFNIGQVGYDAIFSSLVCDCNKKK
jgi:hypothetical protein